MRSNKIAFATFQQPLALNKNKMPFGDAKLFIGQLHFDATEEDVRQLFDYYGEVKHINILREKNSGRSCGSAFVTYGSTEEADAAILALHNIYNMERDKPLQVSYCQKTPNISQFGYEHAQQLASENTANPNPRPAISSNDRSAFVTHAGVSRHTGAEQW